MKRPQSPPPPAAAAKAKRAAPRRKAEPPPLRRPSLADALAAAAWSEADAALAQSMQELAALERSLDRLSEDLVVGRGRLAWRTQTEQAIGEAILARQALDAVARLRGLKAFLPLGAEEAFDPARHSIEGACRRGVLVRSIAPGFCRRVGGRDEVVLPARVERARPARSSARRASPV